MDTNEELSEEEQVQIEKCLVFPLDAENEFSVGLYSEQKVTPPPTIKKKKKLNS